MFATASPFRRRRRGKEFAGDMEALRVFIADDHRLMLAATTRALSGFDDLLVVGETDVGSKVLPKVRESNPDIVLLDLRMPELDGLQCLARLREHHPDVCVILLSSYTDSTHIEAAKAGGAAAYIAKTIDPAELANAIRASFNGDTFTWGSGATESDAAGGVSGVSERSRWCCRRSHAAFRTVRSGKSSGSPSRRSSSTSGTSTESLASRTAPRPARVRLPSESQRSQRLNAVVRSGSHTRGDGDPRLGFRPGALARQRAQRDGLRCRSDRRGHDRRVRALARFGERELETHASAELLFFVRAWGLRLGGFEADVA